ncbi:MAG: hypothetical protein AB1491_00105 [Thermodesulfobacteriota bacterium]
MTLAEMLLELGHIVNDPSLEPSFQDWLNQTIEELAQDFDLPALKRKEPFPLSTNTATWIYTLPETFHKKLFRCLDGDWRAVTICRTVDELLAKDFKHLEIGTRVTHVAVDDAGPVKLIYTYPKANDTLQLWFYEKPNRLAKDGDVPNLMPVEFHRRVILPRVVLRNFQLLQDMAKDPPHKSLLYWEELYRQGLYGDKRGDIGLINWLVRARGGPRRHGGRAPLP